MIIYLHQSSQTRVGMNVGKLRRISFSLFSFFFLIPTLIIKLMISSIPNSNNLQKKKKYPGQYRSVLVGLNTFINILIKIRNKKKLCDYYLVTVAMSEMVSAFMISYLFICIFIKEVNYGKYVIFYSPLSKSTLKNKL